MHEYTLRALVAPDDFPFLRHLHMATMKDYLQQQVVEYTEEKQDELLKNDFATVSHNFQIVMVGGKDVGMVWVENKENEIYLAIIQITPELQGKGLGAQLVQDLVIQPAKNKHVPACMHVLKSNKDALRFYQKLGFKQTEEEANRLKMVLDIAIKHLQI